MGMLMTFSSLGVLVYAAPDHQGLLVKHIFRCTFSDPLTIAQLIRYSRKKKRADVDNRFGLINPSSVAGSAFKY